MTQEELKKFDGTLEGAARLLSKDTSIDWDAVSRNIRVLEEHLQRDTKALEHLKNLGLAIEEQVLMLVSGDPEQEKLKIKWGAFKVGIDKIEQDRREIQDLIDGLFGMGFDTHAQKPSVHNIH